MVWGLSTFILDPARYVLYNCVFIFLPAVKRCSNDALSTIFGFSLTHDNFEKDAAPVGSTVNIHCPDTQLEGKYVRNKRIVKDEWDGGMFCLT